MTHCARGTSTSPLSPGTFYSVLPPPLASSVGPEDKHKKTDRGEVGEGGERRERKEREEREEGEEPRKRWKGKYTCPCRDCDK